MRNHHRQAIDRLVRELEEDPRFLAVLLAGSIARGTELEDSDVDLILIASADEYARRQPDGDFSYLNSDACDYPGGYAEAKVVPLSYLEEVAERGSEPARAAFVGAQVLCSRIPELEPLLELATAYPESQRIANLRSFCAQMMIWFWYIGEAERRDDRYLLLRSVSEFALFAGRMILAHNRMLYPYHKWFMHELERAVDKPDGLMEKLDHLLTRPSRDNAAAVLAAVMNFREWEQPPAGFAGQFMEDSEWPWRRGPAPVADR
jgi:predicted nucleotidyltransferase